MEIEYELNEADILALMQFRLQQTRGKRNPVFVRRFLYLIGFGLLGLGTWGLLGDSFLPIAFLALAIISFIFYPVFFNWLIRRKVFATYRDPNKRVTLATRVLRVNDVGLEERSSLGESNIKWEVITAITETAAYAFISVLNNPMIIVPKERISNDDFQSFVNTCREHMNKKAG